MTNHTATLKKLGERRQALQQAQDQLAGEIRQALIASEGNVSRVEAANLLGVDRTLLYKTYLPNNKQGGTMQVTTILITVGPGSDGIDKTSVGTPGSHACYPTRTFRDSANADALVADLHRQYPDAEIVRQSR